MLTVKGAGECRIFGDIIKGDGLDASPGLGDKLALGSLAINPENDSNGILTRNVVCCVAATAPRRLPESFSFEEGAA
jgi:hypothetical protein